MTDKVPLNMIPEGKEATISKIYAGRGLLRRLTEMGFTGNTKIKILRSDRGFLIVSIKGSKYALSKGIAMKIMVTDN
jgi:ferrous iron transport protein A